MLCTGLLRVCFCTLWICGYLSAPVSGPDSYGLVEDSGTDSGDRESERKKSYSAIPTYMKELYELISKQQRSDLFHDGDTVRSYSDIEPVQKEENVHHRYRFNLTDISNDEQKVKKAELHLFKQYNPKQRTKKAYIQINIINLHNDQIVFSKKLRARKNGWITFSLTKLVKRWVRKPQNNKGVEVTVTTLSHGNSNKVTHFGSKKTFRREPLLVVFAKRTKGTNLEKLMDSQSIQLEFNNNDKRKRAKRSNEVENTYEVTKKCQLVPLFIGLVDIGHEHKFVSPDVLAINQCIGSCKATGRKMKINKKTHTNHGYFQAMAAVMTPGLKLPCCAPSSFENVFVIMNNMKIKDSRVQIFELDNLKATGCKCL